MDAWLVLTVSLPPDPSSLRVRAWRRLRALGAVALKNAVYLLPFTAETHEQFQWLVQEIQKDGGEATLFKVSRIENMAPAELIRLFQDARDQDYQRLSEQYRSLLASLVRKPASSARARLDKALKRLSRELERVKEIDFVDAPGYDEVARLKETIEMRLRPAEAMAAAQATMALDSFRGRRWVTRPRPHVDRLASAWLIRRWIDPEAQFVFAPPEEFPSDAVVFDAPGGEFTHHGEDCTFETLLKRAGLRDRRLVLIAEIVHEVDLRDDRFHREEARGIDLAVRGLLAALKDDQQVLAHGLVLFDGLYAAIGERRQ